MQHRVAANVRLVEHAAHPVVDDTVTIRAHLHGSVHRVGLSRAAPLDDEAAQLAAGGEDRHDRAETCAEQRRTPLADERDALVEHEVLSIHAASDANHVAGARRGEGRGDEWKVGSRAADRPGPRLDASC